MSSYVLVVGFHHKKGTSLEYVYPELETGLDLPPAWNFIPPTALPDGAHNFDRGLSQLYTHFPYFRLYFLYRSFSWAKTHDIIWCSLLSTSWCQGNSCSSSSNCFFIEFLQPNSWSYTKYCTKECCLSVSCCKSIFNKFHFYLFKWNDLMDNDLFLFLAGAIRSHLSFARWCYRCIYFSFIVWGGLWDTAAGLWGY